LKSRRVFLQRIRPGRPKSQFRVLL
jgi:hypothetical protein